MNKNPKEVYKESEKLLCKLSLKDKVLNARVQDFDLGWYFGYNDPNYEPPFVFGEMSWSSGGWDDYPESNTVFKSNINGKKHHSYVADDGSRTCVDGEEEASQEEINRSLGEFERAIALTEKYITEHSHSID